MKSFFLIAVLAVFVSTALALTQSDIDYINKHSSWRASLDAPFAKLNKESVRRMLGVDFTKPRARLPEKVFSPAEFKDLPDEFDSRTNWPECQTMKEIRDQSGCGSCWAFGAVEAMSDRECVFNKKTNLRLSAEDMNSCSGWCGSCDGGQPACAWEYWVSHGLVSEDCYPYSLPGCDHHIPDSPNPCNKTYPTPKCKNACTNPNYNWKDDLHYGAKAYEVRGEQGIMAEIQQNGPCEAAFTVYEDFLAYTGGIYHHVKGSFEGGHAVKFVGWGVENGQKYWIMANSWNTHWGEKGFFRIRKGTNECGIENVAYCGTPKAEN